jgi:hypothetical protein
MAQASPPGPAPTTRRSGKLAKEEESEVQVVMRPLVAKILFFF